MQHAASFGTVDHARFEECEVSDLVRRVAGREAQAFEALYKGLRPEMMASASRWLADDFHAAEDAVEEAFCDIWNKAGRFAGNGSAIGWIRRIVRNKAVDQVRRQSRLVCTEHEEFLDIQADQARGPEAEAAASDRQVLISRGIKSLSAPHREVIRLFYFCELSVDEIADRLETPKGTVKSRLFHARNYLMSSLDIGLEG